MSGENKVQDAVPRPSIARREPEWLRAVKEHEKNRLEAEKVARIEKAAARRARKACAVCNSVPPGMMRVIFVKHNNVPPDPKRPYWDISAERAARVKAELIAEYADTYDPVTDSLLVKGH